MSTQPLTWQQYQALPVDQRRRFLRPDEYKALTAEQRVKLGLEPAQQGAPVDFGGKVLPNPNGVRPMADTESPISDTRLPNGVTFNKQNYQGGAQMDATNPAPADVIPPQMQTIAATKSGPPATLPADFKQWDAAPDTLPADFSKWDQPTQEQPERGIVHGIKEFGAQINPITAVKGIAQAVAHPVDTYKADAEKRTEILQKGKEAYQKGNYTEAAAHLLYGMLPLIGPNLERSGEQFQQGDIAGGVGSSLGQGVAMAAPEVIIKGAPGAIQAVKNATPAGAVAKVARAASDVIDPEITGMLSPRLAHAQKAAGKFADVLEKRAAAAKATPAPEVTAEAAPVEAPAPKTNPATVEKQLNDALGGKPLEKNVPLKQQIPGKLPEGFTPADSTALKGYKYNADAQELETVTATGQRYIHGDVTPEQFAKFDAAESKGKAWNDIRQGSSPLVAKYINGKRVAVKPTSAAPIEAVNPPAAVPAKRFYSKADMIKAGADGYLSRAIKTEIPVEKITGLEPTPAMEGGYQKGTPITQPIEVEYDKANDAYTLYSGNHRVTQAKINGQATIPAFVGGDMTDLLQNSLEQARAARAAKSAPQVVYRARDIGEEGVPLNNQHAQATSDLGQAQQYAEAGQRGANAGEVVKIDLGKLKPSDYVVRTHPNGMKWVQFKRPLTESEVSVVKNAGK